MRLIVGQIFPQELLVIGHLDDQRAIEYVLQPLAEDEGDEMADVHRLGGRTSPSVEVERLAFLFPVQNRMEISASVQWKSYVGN